MENLREFLAQAFDDYSEKRNRPDVAGTSRLSPHLHFGEISPRQIWHGLRAHGREARFDCGRLAQFAISRGSWLARVCASPAVSFSAHTRRAAASAVQTFSVAQGRGVAARLAKRPHRLSDCGRGNARVVDDGLDAQPCAHDRRQFPRKGFTAAVAGRRAVVLGHARGRRPRAEHTRLAVDRRLRRGRRAVFPYFQSRESGREIRSER